MLCELAICVAGALRGVQEDSLRLVPRPQVVRTFAATTTLPTGSRIARCSPTDTDDRFAARQLSQTVLEEMGHGLKHVASVEGAKVVLGVWGRDAAIRRAATEECAALYGAAGPSTSLRAPAPEGYVLVVSPRRIVIAGGDAAGVFYGVQTLKQLLRANRRNDALPCVVIQDWPELSLRAWQDDISRGPIPTLAFLKRQVRTLSEFKLNAFTLYTEHVFRLQKHPTIAPKDGITAAEVRELCEYAKQFHVQVIGNFQSFGHFANILKVKGYEHLAETDWVLTPAKEESYQFLKDVYEEIAPAYDSPLFNINCDETWGLGEGPSKAMVDRMGLGGVYAYHINRIAALLKEYGKTPMMWGDIALNHKDIVQRLPKDLIVLTWAYHAADRWDDYIQPFANLRFRFLVCPGVSCWGQLFPDFETASINIANFVRDGKRYGAMGMLNTTWDDSGENLFHFNWLPLAWGAEVAWKPVSEFVGDAARREREARYERFCDAFGPIFYGEVGDQAVTALVQLSALRSNPASSGMRDGAFWQPLNTLMEKGTDASQAADLKARAQHCSRQLEAAARAARRNGDSLMFAQFAADRVASMADRVLLAVRMATDEAPTVQSFWLTTLQQTEGLRDTYARLWRQEARPWWLQVNLDKWNRMIQELRALPNIPIFRPANRWFSGRTFVQASTLSGAPVHYTTDGSEPTRQSPTFDNPVRILRPTTFRAKAFPATENAPVVRATFRTLRLPARFETNMPVYEQHVPQFAFDEDLDTYFWCSRTSQAGDSFTIILEEVIHPSEIRIWTGHKDHPDDYVAAGVLEVSSDGTLFKPVSEFEKGQLSWKCSGSAVRALRIRVTEPKQNWLCIREVEID
jgi:hypothetical protein